MQESDKTVRLYGCALLFGCIVLIVCGGLIKTWSQSAGKVNGVEPILSLEFARSGSEIKTITSNFSPTAIGELKKILILDWIVIIPTYLLLLLFFTRRFRLRNPKYRRAFEMLVFACIGAVGISDCFENYFSWSALNLSESEARFWGSNLIFLSAGAKWSFLSMSALLLSFLLYVSDGWLYKFIAFLLLGTGFMGFAGLYNYHLFNVFMMLLFWVTLLLGIAYLSFPKKFTR